MSRQSKRLMHMLRGIGLLLLVAGLLTVAFQGLGLSWQEENMLPGEVKASASEHLAYWWIGGGVLAFISGGTLLVWGMHHEGEHTD